MDESAKATLEQLQPLLGQWAVEAVLPGAPPSEERGHTIFQWGPGEAFLVQRWEAPFDAAPDGVAIFAVEEDGGGLIQHYFDSRGVVRQYATSIEDSVWSLRKLTPGFAQRFHGELSTNGDIIEGAWEKPTPTRTGSATSALSTAGSTNTAAPARCAPSGLMRGWPRRTDTSRRPDCAV